MTKALTSAQHFSLVLKYYPPYPSSNKNPQDSFFKPFTVYLLPQKHILLNLISLWIHHLICPAPPEY